MQPTVGEILDGKVTGITKFGAFVALPDGKNGLVHISEISGSYVTSVSDHVSDGQAVKVKVISIGTDGKINLSIKQAQPAPAAAERSFAPRSQQAQRPQYATAARRAAPQEMAEPSFEDKLKKFMTDSDSRISGSRIYSDKKSGYRRKRD